MTWLKDAFNDATDYISEPFKKIAKGDVGDGLLDMAKKFTPAGIIYNQIDTASQRHVHVANATQMPIAVVISANKSWVYADISTAVVTTILTLGSSAPAGLNAIKNATTLKALFDATRNYRAAAGIAGQIYKIFAEKGTTIENGECKDLIQRSNSNPLNYLDPSQYGALFDAKDLTIMIVREDGQSALFDTNSDTSWIAYPPGYCPAKYGTLWEPADSPRAWDVKEV